MNPTSPTIDPARFDVRDIPCRVKHAQIFQRWNDLPVGGHFILINDHDPVPLYYQFEAQYPGAFRWEYLLQGPEEFQVAITRLTQSPTVTPPGPQALGAVKPGAVAGLLEVDARGLEPPEPLMRILNAMETVPAGVTLRAMTDREPCHLFGEAKQRGFLTVCKSQPDGSWHTHLTRA